MVIGENTSSGRGAEAGFHNDSKGQSGSTRQDHHWQVSLIQKKISSEIKAAESGCAEKAMDGYLAYGIRIGIQQGIRFQVAGCPIGN